MPTDKPLTIDVKSNKRPGKQELITGYRNVRAFTMELTETLEREDFVVQSMPDVSPTRWHIAHVTWFFETFVLREALPDYKIYHDIYPYLFNSYYVQAGERFTRSERGLLTRPTVPEIIEYREYVDRHMTDFMEKASGSELEKFAVLINIGINHEQQHQELMVTDIKHVFSKNPLYPVYRRMETKTVSDIPRLDWKDYEGGIKEIGHKGDSFFYDNEKPRHKIFLEDYQLADRLITNREYMEFMEDGGYENQVLWLSDGFASVEKYGWKAPLYWEKRDDGWFNFTLSGFRKVNPSEPVCHVSYYEADAFARWYGARLATEGEWENAAINEEIKGNFVDNRNYHPVPLKDRASLNQLYGDVWEWTGSPYTPYPGYKVPEGAIGEYNGKFMSNQVVLRGGSCATTKSHIRPTYRNFFYPHQKWQFSGIRLAK